MEGELALSTPTTLEEDLSTVMNFQFGFSFSHIFRSLRRDEFGRIPGNIEDHARNIVVNISTCSIISYILDHIICAPVS